MGLLRRLSQIFKQEMPSSNNEHVHENQLYSRKVSKQYKQIVLENGECVNVRGDENQMNAIHTNKYTLKNWVYLMLFGFFKRLLNLYLFIINMISLDYNYLISLFLTFGMHLIIELYFDRLKAQCDEQINSRSITTFSDLKKLVQGTTTNALLKFGERHSLNNNIVDHEKLVNTNNYQKDICIRKVSIDTATYRQDKQQKVPLFTIKRWDQLRVGDIIYLKNNEICPADVLILDMGQQMSMSSNTIMSGNTNEVRKRACQLTTISKEHKIQLLDYRTILNGVIRYDHTDSDQYYKGMVKLKKDPQALEITKENIFFREQQLLNDLYIFGVILAVGLECRCYKSFKQVERFDYFEKKANLYFVIAILSLISLSVIQYIIEYYSNSYLNTQFQLAKYSNLLPLYFYFIVDLLYFIQIVYENREFEKDKHDKCQSVNPLLDSSTTKQHCLQMNYSPISNLSLINHVLIDKTGTLTFPSFKIKWIFIFDSLYKIRYRVFAEKEFLDEIKKTSMRQQLNLPIEENNEIESPPIHKQPSNSGGPNFALEELDDDHPPYDELHRTQQPRFKAESLMSSQFEQSGDGVPLQKHSQPRGGSIVVNSQHESKRNLTYQRGSQRLHAPRIPSNLEIVSEVEYSGNELTLIRRTQDTEFKPHYYEAMFALVLCQNTRSLYQRSDDSFFYEYSNDIDRQQLQLCKHYGFKFICRSKQDHQMKYVIQEGDEIHVVDVMALHQFNSRKFSIILHLSEELCAKLGLDDDSQYIQYLRDDSLDMIGCLSLEKDQMSKLELMIKDIQVQGSRPILYYRNLMNEQQLSTFIKEANKLLEVQSNKVEFLNEYSFLMHEFERNCDLVTVVGVSEKTRKHATSTLNGLKQLGLLCWMVSGDNYEKVLPVAYKVQLLNQQDQIVHIQAKTQDELFLQLKQQLQNLSGQLRSHSNKKEMRHSDTLLHKKGSFTCSPRWISNGQRNLHIRQFQIVVSGESLEIIIKDPYLKKHFQFLLQFTSNFIGYRMTPQQKSLLIRLLQDRKLQSKCILAIGDSFSDIDLFNYADFSFQIQSGGQVLPHDKNFFEDLQHGRVSIKQLDEQSQCQFCSHKKEPSQLGPLYNCDVYLTDFDMIYKIITLESRKSVLYVERLLTFALFRSFGIIYLLCITSLITNQVEVISNDYLKFHTNVFYFLSCGFIVSKIAESIENCNHPDFLTFIFKGNQAQLNSNNLWRQVTGITIYPLMQALLINLFLFYMDSSFRDGVQIDTTEIGSGLFLLLLFVDSSKLLQRHYISRGQFLFNIPLIYALYTLTSLQFPSISIIYRWIISIQTLFSFLFILSIHILYNLIAFHINRPIFQSFIVQKPKEYDEIVKIFQKMTSNITRQIKLHRATFEKISYFARKLFKNDEDMDPILKQMLSGAFADETENSINQITLKFKSQLLQKKFAEDTLLVLVRTYRIIVSTTFLTYEIATFLIVLIQHSSFFLEYWADYYYIAMFCALILLNISCWTPFYKYHFFRVNFVILLIRCVSIVIWLFNENQSIGNASLIVMQLNLAITIYQYQEQPLMSQLLTGICVIIYLIKNSNDDRAYNLINQYVLALATFFLMVLTFRRIMHIFLEVFLGRMNMNKENQIMSDILSILLPQFIRDRINKAGQYDIQEDQGMVAVLFCDIIDFDSLIKNEQSNVVDILDKLFRRFDLLCQQHEVQKIETVGKTYMAAAGLKIHINQKSNPVNKVISLALDMKKHVMSNETFQIKIGIHYGNVIAGVIGHHKPQFSLIGDTINTASRICSTADPWVVAISEQAYRQTNKFELVYTPREVEAKGKGRLMTYIVSTKRGGKQRKQTVMIRRPPKQPFRESKEYNNLDQVHEQASNVQISENPNASNREIQPLVQETEDQQPLILNKKQRNEIYNYVTRTQKQISESTPRKSIQQQPIPIPSSIHLNLNAGGGSSKNYPSQSIVAGMQQSQQFDEKHQKHTDLIQILERRTKCDLNVSDYQINMEYDVEKDKLKALYSVDEDQQGQIMLLTLNPKKLYLEFNEDNEITQEFYEFMNALYRPFAVWQQLTIGLCVVISSLSVVSLNDVAYLSTIILGLIVGLLHLLLSILINRYEAYYNVKYFTILSYMLLASYALDCFMITTYDEIQISKGIIYGLSVNLNRILRHEHKLIYLVLQTIVTICAIIFQQWPWSHFYYAFVFAIYGFCIQFFMFLKNVNSYNVNKQLIEKSMKYQYLLNYLLPKNVLEEFFRPNEEKRVLREESDEVTLLFADIAGFTEYSSKVQPEQVVNMLRNLFTEFDKICLLTNVFKLYTIGDCYVVMGMVDYGKGVQRNPSQEAVNVVRMGFSMIEVIRRVRAHINHPTLDMRIGVHTGSIIGGVLGTELVRYDIYGPDVLIANKMESKGTKGFVQVSQETKDIIEREFPDLLKFEFTQSIEFESIERRTSGYFVYQ